MTYNLTNLSGVINIYELTAEVNNLTNGVYSVLFLASIFFVMFVAMKKYDTTTVFVASSFVTLIISALLHFLGMLAMMYLVITMLLFVASLIFKLVTDS